MPAPTPMTTTDAVLDAPQEPPSSAFPPGLGLGSDDGGPEDAFAMPVRESSARPMWIYVVAGVLALVVAVVLFNLVFGGGDEPGEPSPSGDTGGQVSGQEATVTMCGHVRQGLQVFREDALGVAAQQLQGDASALKQAGERQTAKEVRVVIVSIEDARQALADQQDTTEPFAALRKAIKGLPC